MKQHRLERGDAEVGKMFQAKLKSLLRATITLALFAAVESSVAAPDEPKNFTPSSLDEPMDSATSSATNAPPELLAWRKEWGPTRDQRMAWWRAARFGMFIHWGIYSIPAGVWQGQEVSGAGEWIMHRGRIPVANYQAFARQFNPTNFNAEQWVKIAKDAGMKYIVITAKHHDGFAMFRSSDPYNICDATPFKRDPLAELAAACRKKGIKLGFYYSQSQDWGHPGGGAASPRIRGQPVIDKDNHWDPAQQGSMDDYLDQVAVPQIKELLTNYGPGVPAILWFDTPGVRMTTPRVKRISPLLKLRPDIVVNNRLDTKEVTGDFTTPEQHIPPTRISGRDWETCMTMNRTWGFRSPDTNWKSAATLITNLVDIASKGGNYLLNVGPTSLGEIPQASVERLAEVGQWMKVNGEAIYGTTASPFSTQLPWGRCTKKITDKGGTLYLHVFDWPKDGRLVVPGLRSRVTSARLLATHEPVVAAAKGGNVVLSLPASAPDTIASVIELRFAGPLGLPSPEVTSPSP